jgi:DNA-binding transcriptional ArsR family regulator
MGKLVKQAEYLIIEKITFAKGNFVIPVKDLADLYGIKQEAILEAIRNSKNMFPEEFVVELPLKKGEAGKDRDNLALTDMGVGALPGFIKSGKVADQNVTILRIFRRLRELVELYYCELVAKMDEIEKKIHGEQDMKLKN